MQETNISFYLKANRIHFFLDALRGLGSPSRICIMIEADGKTLLIAPYEKRDFKSIGVPPDVYNGTGCMEVSSMKLCRIIADLHHWDMNHSYRVPGKIHAAHNVAIFSLTEAAVIGRDNNSSVI